MGSLVSQRAPRLRSGLTRETQYKQKADLIFVGSELALPVPPFLLKVNRYRRDPFTNRMDLSLSLSPPSSSIPSGLSGPLGVGRWV